MRPDALDQITIAEIALEASVDRRTVRRALAGRPIRGLAGARVQRALEAHRTRDSAERETERRP